MGTPEPTTELIAKAQQLADAATPGPWTSRVEGGVSRDGDGWHNVEVDFAADNPCAGLIMGDDENDQADAEFIAWCRQGVPQLIEKLVDARRDAVTELADDLYDAPIDWPDDSTALAQVRLSVYAWLRSRAARS